MSILGQLQSKGDGCFNVRALDLTLNCLYTAIGMTFDLFLCFCLSQDCDCLASQAQLASILMKKEGPNFFAKDGRHGNKNARAKWFYSVKVTVQ